MAASNVYEIRILFDPNEQGAGDAPIAKLQGGKADVGKKGGEAEGAGAVIAGSLKAVRPFIDTAMAMRSQYVSTVTGSRQLEQKTAFYQSFLSTGLDVVQGAASGGGIAAALGIASGPVGVAVGAAVAIAGKALEIAQRAADIANKKEVESTAISVGKARAGISWNMSRRK